MDIIFVACHYSTRFNINNFISKCSSKTKQSLYKFSDMKLMYNDFLTKYTIHLKENSMHKKDMLFLWNLYTYDELLPQIQNEKNITDNLSMNIEFENGQFKNVHSDLLEEVKEFIVFVNKSFQNHQEYIDVLT